MKNKRAMIIIIIIIIVKKKHENVFKNWLCPNFLLLPPKNGGLQPPLAPPGPYAPLNETKKDKLFFKRLRSSYLFG